jgi:hypothetical protein
MADRPNQVLVVYPEGKIQPLGFFFGNVPKEERVSYYISAPPTLRLNTQSVEPFQRMILPPSRGTMVRSCIEVEHSSDGSHMAMDVQFLPV